ncbi:PCNA [Haloferax tailed virus 1]|uniref:PCNA n=1 Tax=Haloferax tailed virus 1 TaxID=2507575 RepID=A0A410N6U7_HFTV1|nr:PCNA [Haloferax tailed virus 1]QAS68896.1 PCNA [Haloferax tailed virus 1]
MQDIAIFDHQTEEYGTIETTGATVKPWFKAIGYLVDEAKVNFESDGLHVTAVDAANVGMIDARLHKDAFDTYDVDEHTQGFDINKFVHGVRRARVNSDDELTLSLGNNETKAVVSRGYDQTNVVSQNTIKAIDPDSIRQEPDIPDLELSAAATVDYKPFMDALDHVVAHDTKMKLGTAGTNLLFGREYTLGSAEVVFDGIDVGVDIAKTWFSGDYVQELQRMLKKVRPDTVTLEWGEEMPLYAYFGTEFAEYTFVLAPRIQSN